MYVCKTQMPPIIANSKDDQGHKDNMFIIVGLITRNALVQYESSNTYYLEVIFLKIGQTQRSKSWCKK